MQIELRFLLMVLKTCIYFKKFFRGVAPSSSELGTIVPLLQRYRSLFGVRFVVWY